MNGDFNVFFQGKYIRWTLIFKDNQAYVKRNKEEILLSKENVSAVYFDRVQEADQAIRDYMKGAYGMPTNLTDHAIGNKRYFEVKIKHPGYSVSLVNMLYDDAEKFKKILKNQGIKVYGY